jgi:hypothetical protein
MLNQIPYTGEGAMRKRQRKPVKRVIPLTPAANEYLNAQAEELGLTGAEHLRRLIFVKGYSGLVLDDVRAILAETGESISPADYHPYVESILQRLDDGIREAEEVEAFARDLPTHAAHSVAVLKKIRQEYAEHLSEVGAWLGFQTLINKSKEGRTDE